MSQISLKSISGITSITTSTGVDNQLTLHTNNTTQAFKLDHAGNLHFNNHVNTTGISSASNFKTGTSDLHSLGLTAASADIDDFLDVGSNIKLGNAGVITATSYRGDGSQLTGIVAGLSTISGVVNVANDLDVDGHTNLDNVSIVGITTTSARLDVGNNGTNAVDLRFRTNRGSAGQTIANLNYEWDGTTVAQIRGIAGSDTTNKDDGHLAFFTTPAGSGSFSERLRILSNGNVLIGTTVDGNQALNVYGAANAAMVVQNSNTGTGANNGLYIGNGNSTISYIWNYENDSMRFATNNTERLRIRSDGKVVIGTNYTGADLSVTGNLVLDNGTTARLTLQAENNNTNQILSTTTGFGSYTALKYMAADHKFQYGGNELVRIHAISKGIQVYGGDLLLGPDSVSQMEATIRAWGCSLWYTTIDSNYYHDSGGEFRQFYNKGSYRGDNYLTAYNCPIQTGVGPQNRVFWRGAQSDTRAEGSLNLSVGYRGAFFFIGQASCASIPYQGNGRYLFDGNSPSRVSVSFDSFGSDIDSGELSFHAGSTAGYNSGDGSVGSRLGSSNTDSTLRMYCVGVNMENYNAPNSKRAGNHLGISVINDDGTDYGSSRLSENLINNSTTGSTNTTNEFNWANRHSNDRGGTTTFRHSQIMYFDDIQLNSAQWDYLEHYFKVMYG